jgi:arylsulfatase A-like enzyme
MEDRMGHRKVGMLSRKSFLKTVGAGTAGTALLGAPALSGCESRVGTERRPKHRLNVILIILDTLRKDHVGAYGNDRIKTPTLDALAEESLLFTRALPEAMPTIPARRAMHTGMRTWPTGPEARFGWTPIPSGQTTLAEILAKEGYGTFLVTDTYVQFPMNFGRGFEAYRMIRGQENDRYKDPSVISEEEM